MASFKFIQKGLLIFRLRHLNATLDAIAFGAYDTKADVWVRGSRLLEKAAPNLPRMMRVADARNKIMAGIRASGKRTFLRRDLVSDGVKSHPEYMARVRVLHPLPRL